MQSPALIDPGMFTESGPFMDTFTMQSMGSTINSFGEPDRSDTNWTSVAGLTTLPCYIAMGTGVERRGQPMTVAVGEYSIMFPAYYPTILSAMRGVDQLGRVFNVLGVQHALEAVTMLRAEIVTGARAL